VVAGFCLFYVLEQFIGWHHHHGATGEHEPVSYLVLVSDTIHSCIDGLVIAGAFLPGVDVGLVTAVAIALREIPQEIGDFGVLVHGGFDRTRALVLNYLTQATLVSTAELVDALETAGFTEFEFVQTIYDWPGDVDEVQQVSSGYGEGSFVGIRATG
jgi:zinc transporter ZupT